MVILVPLSGTLRAFSSYVQHAAYYKKREEKKENDSDKGQVVGRWVVLDRAVRIGPFMK